MPVDAVHPHLVAVALDRVGGNSFEHFVNDFYPAIAGRNFVPLGGVKDGGADAFVEPIHQRVGRATSFYQASVTPDVESKLRATVVRLREFGRDPQLLTYVTSRSVKHLDQLEADLSEELDLAVRIRDAGYITSHINDSAQTRAAFAHHLQHATEYLKSIGASRIIAASEFVRTPNVYVFLTQELDRRAGDASLIEAVTDTLCLWALEGTDPDAGLFRSTDDVLARILDVLPSVRELVGPHIRGRLEAMAGRAYSNGRQVRWHRQDDVFCLPFETRNRIGDENVSDEALRIDMLKSLDDRIRSNRPEGLGDVGTRQAAEIALRALQLTFEREGLQFAAYLEREPGENFPTVADSINDSLNEASVGGKRRTLIAEAVFDAIRGVLYASRDNERIYLRKLARTYALLFTLNTEPQLIDFFQQMAGDFYLYVGADQLGGR